MAQRAGNGYTRARKSRRWFLGHNARAISTFSGDSSRDSTFLRLRWRVFLSSLRVIGHIITSFRAPKFTRFWMVGGVGFFSGGISVRGGNCDFWNGLFLILEFVIWECEKFCKFLGLGFNYFNYKYGIRSFWVEFSSDDFLFTNFISFYFWFLFRFYFTSYILDYILFLIEYFYQVSIVFWNFIAGFRFQIAFLKSSF